MNIDYEAIYTAAAKRRAGLENVETLLNNAPYALAQAQILQAYLRNLDTELTALDAEGLSLLPGPVARCQSKKLLVLIADLIDARERTSETEEYTPAGLTTLAKYGRTE